MIEYTEIRISDDAIKGIQRALDFIAEREHSILAGAFARTYRNAVGSNDEPTVSDAVEEAIYVLCNYAADGV